MTCLVIDSSAGRSTVSLYPLAVPDGWQETATRTCEGRTTGGGTSASSALAAPPSRNPATTEGSERPVLSAARTCKGACGETLPLTTDHFYFNKQDGVFWHKCKACARAAAKTKGEREAAAAAFPPLPVWPLAARIAAEVAREERATMAWDGSRVVGAKGLGAARRVCAWLGITDDRYRKWRSGATKTVEFDVADAILLRAGWLWWEAWPMPEPTGCVLRYLDAAEAHLTAMRAFEGEEAYMPVDLEFLRESGRRLRDVLEESPTASAVAFEFGPDVTLRYERGAGLVVLAAGERLVVPEDAIDDRWEVAGVD